MRRLASLCVLASLEALASTSRPRFEPAAAEVAVTGRWLVMLRSDVGSVDEAAASIVAGRGRVITVYQTALTGFEVELPDALAPQLAENTMVLQVVQDRRVPNALSTPISDCSMGVAFAQSPQALPETITCADPEPQNPNGVCTDNWGLDRLDGPTVTRDGFYDPPRTGAGVHVFLIDTGLYAANQEFTGRVGLGFDATGTGGTGDCGSWSHGTHAAGIAVGARFGVAKGATIHPVRVATCPAAIQLSYLIAAFDWVAQVHGSTVPGPAVASLSLNGATPDFSDPGSMLNLAIAGMINAGVLLVESAGNNQADACNHVSRAPGVLIVGGSDELDRPWKRRTGDPNYDGWCGAGGDCGSNVGACVSLFAPGAHIVSSWLGASPDPRNMCRLSGTSMAAPHVAGAAALSLQANPSATPAQLKQALIDQAKAVLTEVPAGTTNKLLSVIETKPGASVSPTMLSFGTLALQQTSAPKQVTVSSTGTAALHVGTVATTGDFQVQSNGCTSAIAPGTSCTISITFRASAMGQRTGTLTVSSDDPVGSRTVALVGAGALSTPTLRIVVEGPGTVTSAPVGIVCGAMCEAAFASGTVVSLGASPEAGATFIAWSEASCTGTTCNLTLSQSVTVTARFAGSSSDSGSAIRDAGGGDAGDVGVDGGGRDGGFDGGSAGGAGRADAGSARDGGALISGETAEPGCGCASVDGANVMLLLIGLLIRYRTASKVVAPEAMTNRPQRKTQLRRQLP